MVERVLAEEAPDRGKDTFVREKIIDEIRSEQFAADPRIQGEDQEGERDGQRLRPGRSAVPALDTEDSIICC